MTPTDMIQCLRETQALLRRDGWQQYDRGPRSIDEHAPRCITGAMQVASRSGPMFMEVRSHLQGTIFLDCPPGVLEPHIAEWNDAPGRSEDEVHDLIDRTIQRLEDTIPLVKDPE